MKKEKGQENEVEFLNRPAVNKPQDLDDLLEIAYQNVADLANGQIELDRAEELDNAIGKTCKIIALQIDGVRLFHELGSRALQIKSLRQLMPKAESEYKFGRNSTDNVTQDVEHQ